MVVKSWIICFDTPIIIKVTVRKFKHWNVWISVCTRSGVLQNSVAAPKSSCNLVPVRTISTSHRLEFWRQDHRGELQQFLRIVQVLELNYEYYCLATVKIVCNPPSEKTYCRKRIEVCLHRCGSTFRGPFRDNVLEDLGDRLGRERHPLQILFLKVVVHHCSKLFEVLSFCRKEQALPFNSCSLLLVSHFA